ncbi:MAG: hypothetical protein PHO15_03630 [Eubacteriales bacterium]|nr:hypothetical protein [Eubacteriales bacterium]
MRSIEEIEALIEYEKQYINSKNKNTRRMAKESLKRFEAKLRELITSGIPLDLLKEICAAERDGRYVVLPCKEGDTVYKLCPNNNANCDRCAWGSCGCNGLSARNAKSINTMPHRSLKWIWLFREDFGKTVFLTREAAEAALAEQEAQE